MGAVHQVSALGRRRGLRRRNGEPNRKNQDLDIRSGLQRKWELALKRSMNADMQSRGFRKGTASRGFSLIELMIAMTVLAIGLLGGIAFIAVATASNGRSRLNTTAATLAESTMERIVAIPQKATGAAALTTLTDCSGHSFTINTAPGGSPLIASWALAGSVDYSQPAVAEYSMPYVVCPS